MNEEKYGTDDSLKATTKAPLSTAECIQSKQITEDEIKNCHFQESLF